MRPGTFTAPPAQAVRTISAPPSSFCPEIDAELQELTMNCPLVAVVLALSSACATGAQAALVISKAPTTNVTCDQVSCSATHVRANLNVRDLTKILNARDLTVIAGS